ncbi:MAG: hypothetical protein WCG27_10730, partial [Pseudomonadota bacterium]
MNLNQLVCDIHYLFFSAVLLCYLYFAKKEVTTSPESGHTTKIILAGLSFAACASALLVLWPLEHLILTILFSLLVGLSFFHPRYALAFALFTFVARPWESFPLEMSFIIPKGVIGVCIFSYFIDLYLKKDFSFRWNISCTLLLFYTFWAYLAMIQSPQATEVNAYYFDVFIKPIIFFLLIFTIARQRYDFLLLNISLFIAISEMGVISYVRTFYMESLPLELATEYV